MDLTWHEFQQPIYGGVNVLRIGDVLVDTGHVAPRCRDAVAAALEDDLAGVSRVLLTHPHIDHVGGSQTIDALARLPHTVPAGAPAIIEDYGDYIRDVRADMTRLLAGFGVDETIWDPYFPAREDFAEGAVEIDRVLEDGDTVRAGEWELTAIHTPGHSAQHLAFWHEPSRTCLSADLVSRNGHFMYGPLYADIGAYRASLERIAALDPDRLVPMHGPPIDAPGEHLADCLEKADETERRLRRWLTERDSFYARHFTRDVIGATAANAGFLTLVVYAYLEHLADDGACSVSVGEDGILARR